MFNQEITILPPFSAVRQQHPAFVLTHYRRFTLLGPRNCNCKVSSSVHKEDKTLANFKVNLIRSMTTHLDQVMEDSNVVRWM